MQKTEVEKICTEGMRAESEHKMEEAKSLKTSYPSFIVNAGISYEMMGGYN